MVPGVNVSRCATRTSLVAFGDERPTGQTALVIQLEMELDGSLGPYEPSPIEHRGTQLDDRRIQGP